MSGAMDGPGEGTWSVFALKVVEERDSLRQELELAKAFHDVACKERDFYKTRLAHAEADAEQAIHSVQQESAKALSDALDERNRARSERDQADAYIEKLRTERDELSAQLMRIRAAYDVCSEVGHPCQRCSQTYATRISELLWKVSQSEEARKENERLKSERDNLREVLTRYYDECSCEHDAMDALNMEAFRLISKVTT